MIIVTTRSSRLFLVVLHLVCASTNLGPTERINGILSSVWTETVAPTQNVRPVTSRIPVAENSGRNTIIDDTSKLEPFWLQDAQDQKCFGSMGLFSECGDANLWRVIPKANRHARRRQWIRWAMEDEIVDQEAQESLLGYYALQVFDQDISELYDPSSTNISEGIARAPPVDSIDDFTKRECISRRRKDNKLVIVPCSEDRAWYWRLNEYGILHFDKPARGLGGSSRRSSAGNRKRLLSKRQNLELCVWRKNSSEAFLSSCDGNQPFSLVHNSTTSPSLKDGGEGRVAQIQFLSHSNQREFHVFQPSLPEKKIPRTKSKLRIEKQVGESEPQKATESPKKTSSSEARNTHLPSRVDIAHSHASVPSDRRQPRFPTLQTKSILPHQSSEKVSKEIPHFLGNTNPILLATGSIRDNLRTGSTRTGEEKSIPQARVHSSENTPSSFAEKPIVRKIQTNPYIEASSNERWSDPQTGLVYRTDLCQYLGHERKDAGRHTLTGVGQYTKTMLNIKVYGVGLYVSKRDILADPSFEPYASLSSEHLRQSGDFFRILRTMKGFAPTNEPAGSFDRTIFLKINMQLSTETMRSSLDADWKMLTAESKELLIGSSMKPRPADPIFLEIAASPDNPNRCTCAQIAPEEYNADPSCCARGTELVFTWRKNGNLEVRLNGVFMDSFPRPDIAEGIFFEYLRLDNPMSFDFLDRAMDGFPALLAPLSQVKGIATPVTAHHTNTPNQGIHGGNPLFRFVGGFGGVITSQAATFADFVQSGTQELAVTAIDKARYVGSTARNLGEEVERRRDLIGKHVSAFTNQALSSLVPSSQKSVSVQYPGWITDSELEDLSDEIFEQNSITAPVNEKSFTRMVSRVIGLEDDSLSASNITQKLVFGMVHLYLLLLLIASFPAQWTTRTKLVVCRKTESLSHNVGIPTDSENSDSDDSGASSVAILDTGSMALGKESQIKKSLSYAL